MGMLLASNMPKPNPKQKAAPITWKRESPKPTSSKDGMVNPNPMALVKILPLTFFCTHLSERMPPKMTPRKEEAAMVMVDNGPAEDMSISSLLEKSVGSQFFTPQPGRLGMEK